MPQGAAAARSLTNATRVAAQVPTSRNASRSDQCQSQVSTHLTEPSRQAERHVRWPCVQSCGTVGGQAVSALWQELRTTKQTYKLRVEQYRELQLRLEQAIAT